jgi:DNA-binding transcriptional MocR family regulator
LESAGITFAGPIGEGMFLWGRLPEAVAVDDLVRRAREKAILLANGALFSAQRGTSHHLRFNVAHSAAPPLVEFLGHALRAT